MLYTEPKKITKGVTTVWQLTLADYPADEWDLTYYFRGDGVGADVAAVAVGTDFEITLSSAISATFAVGNYAFQALVVKGGEPYLVRSGDIQIEQSLADLATNLVYDARSVNKVILDKIDAMISGSLDKNVQEYTIENRQLRRYTFDELIKLRDKYAGLVAQESTGTGGNSPFLKARKYRHWKAR